MASLPLDPTFAHLLLKSQELGCVSEALTAVSLLSSDNIFLQPHRDEEKRAAAQAHRNFASKDGDLPTLINIFSSWRKVSPSSLPLANLKSFLLIFTTRPTKTRSGLSATSSPTGH